MQLELSDLMIRRGRSLIRADGIFPEGVHLVTGPAGSGKSTLSHVAAGLLSPDSGEVRNTGTGPVMLAIQYPEQQVTGRTLIEEGELWGDPAGLIAAAGLSGREDSDPALLSRGEQRRFQLACVFSADAGLLILDEPFSSLDCREKQAVCHRIAGRRSGTITVICTNEQQILPDVDFIWEITGGKLVALGRPPGAICRWSYPPGHIRALAARGRTPENLSNSSVMEAACGTRE